MLGVDTGIKVNNIYSLAGLKGNAISIVDYVVNAMRKERRPTEEIGKYISEAYSGGFSKLYSVSMDKLNELNEGVINEKTNGSCVSFNGVQ